MSVASRLAGLAASRVRRWDPARVASRGRRLGRSWYRLDGRRREVALRNLAMAFPDTPEAWRRDVARGSFEQVGRTALETLWCSGATRADLDRIVAVEDFDVLRSHLDRGRGAILAGSHFGNWELMGVAFGLLGIPCVSVARPLDDPALGRLLDSWRTRTGSEVVAKRNALRAILRALQEGKVVAILMDQNTQRHEAVFVPYFGRLAATPPAVAHLHLRSGAPVLPAFAAPDGDRYRLSIEDPVTARSERREDAVAEITARVTARIEDRVRRQPDAWLWMHDRWRERPLEEVAS